MLYTKILNDFLFFFFGLFIVGSTFSIALGQISLGVALLLFLIIILRKTYNPLGNKLSLIYKIIGLYIFWMALASLFGATPLRSLMILKEEWLFLAIPIGVYVLARENFRQMIINAFAVSAGVVSIYAIIQHFTGIHWFKDRPLHEAYDFGYMVKGFFAHRLTFGNYYATAAAFFIALSLFPSSLSSKQKKLMLSSGLLCALATLFTYSYGPIMALFLSIGLIALMKNRTKSIIAIIALGAVIAGSIIFIPNLSQRISDKIEIETSLANEASRVYIWDSALEIAADNPIFGVGQGNFYDTFEANRPGHRIHVHAHNDLLNVAAMAGIPGLIFFFAIWVILFMTWKSILINDKTNQTYAAAALIGTFAFFITSITEATFADEEVRQMLMFIWAVGLFPLGVSYTKRYGTA